jgi:hypothetical protein
VTVSTDLQRSEPGCTQLKRIDPGSIFCYWYYQ